MPPVFATAEALVELAGLVLESMSALEIASAAFSMVSAAYSIISMFTSKSQDGFSSQIAGRTEVIRSAVAPHRVVYGKCLISGPLVAFFSCGTNNNIIYLVVALTSHQVAGIDDVYLNDVKSTDSQFSSYDPNNPQNTLSYYPPRAPGDEGLDIWTNAPLQIPAGGKITLLHGIDFLHPFYVKVGITWSGSPSFGNIIGRNFSGGSVTNLYTIQGRTLTFDPSLIDQTYVIVYYKSWVSISKHLGSPTQLADPELIADAVDRAANHVWTENHKLSGRAYIVVRLEYNAAIFTNLPNIKAVVRGVQDIYDPRTSSNGWTDNAALCVRDFIVKSFGIGSPNVNDTNFIAAANICDEQVAVAAGTGSGYTTDGEYYAVNSIGINLKTGSGTILAGDTVTITIVDAYYNIGGVNTHFPASANSYVVETALQSGYLVLSGTGLIAAIPPVACAVTVTPSNYENRYTCNGSFTLDQKPVDIMKQLLTACAGKITWSQGLYNIFPAAYSYPVGNGLSENDLRDDISIAPAPSRAQRFNTVRGTFVSPDQYWQQVDFPFQQDSTQYTIDGVEICQTLELPYTISAAAAQRLALIYLKQNLHGIQVTFPAKITALPYQPGDVLNLSIAQLSWVNKQFRVQDWKLSDNGGVDLSLKEEDSTIYGWLLAGQQALIPPPHIQITPYTIPVPDVEDFSVAQSGGFCVFNWTDVGTNVAGYDIRYNTLGNTSWSNGILITSVNKGTHLVSYKVPPGTWTFMICARDAFGNFSVNPATCDLTVLNTNLVVSGNEQGAQGWPGQLTNLLPHPLGALVPLSQGAASGDDWATFDKFCPNPYDTYTYITPVLMLPNIQAVRALAQLVSKVAPTDNFLSLLRKTPQLYICTSNDNITWSDWIPWTIGNITAKYVQMAFTMLNKTGLFAIQSFYALLDNSSRIESGSGVSVVAEGTTITFAQPFNNEPNIQITPLSAGTFALSQSTTGFTIMQYTGMINWIATGV